ncbi:hypothetical protein FK521_30185, partial [Klebsiella pneumoniae]|nr:hypothetical protein [Klebsiella pneumoniae]
MAERNAKYWDNAHTICGYSMRELEPRLFSFNNPAGACPTCDEYGLPELTPQAVDALRVAEVADLAREMTRRRRRDIPDAALSAEERQ